MEDCAHKRHTASVSMYQAAHQHRHSIMTCRLEQAILHNWFAVQATAFAIDAVVIGATVMAAWQVRKLVRLHVNCTSSGQGSSATLLIPPFIKSCHQVIEQCLWICILIKISAHIASWALLVQHTKVSIHFLFIQFLPKAHPPLHWTQSWDHLVQRLIYTSA